MLTAKHIDQHGGETIVACHAARTMPGYDSGTHGDRIELQDEGQRPIRIYSGALLLGGVMPAKHCCVFLMNERGATVATYRYATESEEQRETACTDD